MNMLTAGNVLKSFDFARSLRFFVHAFMYDDQNHGLCQLYVESNPILN